MCYEISWYGKNQRRLLRSALFINFIILPVAGMYVLENVCLVPFWMVICWMIICFFLTCLGIKIGAIYPPIWPACWWFRRLNAALYANDKRVRVCCTVTVLLAMALYGLWVAYDGYFEISATLMLLMFLMTIYISATILLLSRSLHYEGLALRKTKQLGALSLHLTELSSREAAGVFRKFDDAKIQSMLNDVCAKGYTEIEVVSPNPVVIRHAKEKFMHYFGMNETTIVSLDPQPLGRLETLLFEFVYGGRVKGHKEEGCLLQTGFLVKI